MPVITTFDVESLPPQARVPAIGSAFAAMPQQLCVRLERVGRVRARFDRADLHGIRLERYDIAGLSGVAERRATTTDDSAIERSLTLHHLDAGAIAIRHGDRSTNLRAGSSALTDMSTPLSMRQGDRSAMTTLTVPHDRLDLPESTIRSMLARPMTAQLPIATTIANTVARIARDIADSADAPWQVLDETLVDLMRALVTLGTGDERAATGPLGASLADRILTYLEEHVLDADLTADRIAAAHRISVRYLYVVLSSRDIALGDWIRTTRIRYAGTMLRDEPTVPIADIAHRCGFSDHAHFARSFRSHLGMTPTMWRTEVQNLRLPPRA